MSDGNSLKNGEKDDVAASKFIYRDKFSRTGWLNMMSERLRMAKDLLKEDGVIFVSIDDTEQAYLKVLMDEIFGEENFIEIFLWNKNSGGTSLSNFTKQDFEYVLCFAKNIKKINHKFLSYFSDGMGDSSLINQPNKYKKLIFPPDSIFFPNIKNSTIKKEIYRDLELHNDIIVENNKNKNTVEIGGIKC
ncbi:site-specific DNA-methyltransferase [Mycoplasma sp. HS2188]|uniref:site-specific DNA-methyltransferase n=1 Tax=Mycoplasma sp. HS2188 TaxID=2976765 RepID=UPI00288ADB19|nr:site-specific DNA-methyltransferase [Mycoplasma sp. HS2188]